MERLIFSMLALALQWFRPRYNAQLRLTAAQIRIPRSRIGATRIVPTPKEKAELLRIGESLGHDVAEVMHVVQPETYRRWVRQSRRVRAPRANAFAETWIEFHERECLNFFICFNLDQLDYIEKTWVHYYNTERPHRGIGMNNDVLDEAFQPKAHGKVRCKQQLGGIIKSYYREAA